MSEGVSRLDSARLDGARGDSVIDHEKSAKMMCPSWNPNVPGRVYTERSAAGEPWVFPGSIGVRTDDFDPTIQRTTHACIAGNCPNHNDDGCLVGQWAMSLPDIPDPGTDRGADCPLVSTCRWRSEQGSGVCGACTTISHWVVERPPNLPQELHEAIVKVFDEQGESATRRIVQSATAYNDTGDLGSALAVLGCADESN